MSFKITKAMQDIAAYEAKVQAKKNAARDDAIETVNSIISMFGLKASDLDFSGNAPVKTVVKAPKEKIKSARKPVAPKYRGPQGELWTGRGKRPHWVVVALQSGQTLEDMLIEKPAANALEEKTVQSSETALEEDLTEKIPSAQ